MTLFQLLQVIDHFKLTFIVSENKEYSVQIAINFSHKTEIANIRDLPLKDSLVENVVSSGIWDFLSWLESV